MNATNYTVSTWITADQSSWAYTVRGRKGVTLATSYGFKTRSEADGAAHAWLRAYLVR